MYMRLGFAVAINVDPDVLLVDEVLAVGDESFTHKCLDKFAEFRRRGRTVLLVTHSLDLVTRFCDEALWLDGGVAKAQGDPKRVIDAYLMDVAGTENVQLAADDTTANSQPNPESRIPSTPLGASRIPTPGTCSRSPKVDGDRARSEITAVEMVGATAQPAHFSSRANAWRSGFTSARISA